MLCTGCVNEIPDGSLACPMCGRRFGGTPEEAPPTGVTLNSPEPTPVNDPRRVAYIQQHERLFKERRARSGVPGFVLMFLVAGATFFFLSVTVRELVEKFSPILFVLFCFFVGVVANCAFDSWLMRKPPITTLPCPYCDAPLPLFKSEGMFKPLKWVEACPKCGHELPFRRKVERPAPTK
jgi:hypothetical protein